MSNMMELNRAAQARSDDASQAARAKCLADLRSGDIAAELAIQFASSYDSMRTAMFTARFLRNGDKAAFTAGICAIHGAYARAAIDREFDKSKLIGSGTFGGIG